MLSNIELEQISAIPEVIQETVIRPQRRRYKKTEKELLNENFADTVSNMSSYSVKNDKTLRNIHQLAYNWSKDESTKDIEYVITSYCPIRVNISELKTLINNAANHV